METGRRRTPGVPPVRRALLVLGALLLAGCGEDAPAARWVHAATALRAPAPVPAPPARHGEALVVSPDDAHLAWVEQGHHARGGARARVWFDGRPGPWFDHVHELVLAPRGGGRAYVALQRGADAPARVVRDGRVGPALQVAEHLAWSPDGAHLAYYGRRAAGSGLLVDNIPQSAGFVDIPAPAVFAPDGAAIAYVASAEGGWRVVLDGEPGPVHADIRALQFAPDGRTPVYVVRTDAGTGVVIGDVPGPLAPETLPPRFDASGAHHAYVQTTAEGLRLVVDDAPQPLPGVSADAVALAPGGTAVAVRIQRADGRMAVVIDGEAGPPFDGIDDPLTWVDADTLHYTARRSGAALRVEARRR